MTRFSVIITTYNRVDKLPRAVESVLAQDGDFELVIVDDGSVDGTDTYLAQLADPRVRVVSRPNGGLSAARNTGLEKASGDWVVFLDDDDEALPGWLKTFAELSGPTTGIVCCAAAYHDEDGRWRGTARPEPMGPLFADQSALFLAGAFACRTDLVRSAGGYDEQMTCLHQTELALRLTALLAERVLKVESSQDVYLRLEMRDPNGRPMSSPTALLHGNQRLLSKHRERLADYPETRALCLGVIGVSAARLERWQESRKALLASVRADPRRVRPWMRLALSMSPPLARRVWQSAKY